MDASKARAFLASRTGNLLILGIIAAILLGAVSFLRERKEEPGKPPSVSVSGKKNGAQKEPGSLGGDGNEPADTSQRREVAPATPAVVNTTAHQTTNGAPVLVEKIGHGEPVRVANSTSSEKELIARLEEPTQKAEQPEIVIPDVRFSEKYAPYGRMIRCELVNTLESCNLGTPIVALVTRDVLWNGRVIIKANSEIHGESTEGKIRDRICSKGNWVIVSKPKGEELLIKGIALDQENPSGDPNGPWGIEDGSLGLKGRMIDERDQYKIEMWIASFISGMAPNLQKTEMQSPNILNPSGTRTPIPNVNNALLGGAKTLMDSEVERIKKAIEEAGYYARVPGGKQFYVYVQQAIDGSKAAIGETTRKAIQAAAIAEAQRTGAKVRKAEEIQQATMTPSERTAAIAIEANDDANRRAALALEKAKIDAENAAIVLDYQQHYQSKEKKK